MKNSIYDYEVEHYTSLDAVIFRNKKTGHMYNCNDKSDMQILRNVLCGTIRQLQGRNKELSNRLKRIEDIIDEKYDYE